MAPFYGSGIFYGSGSFYTGASSAPANGIPQDLRFYRTSQDGIYVFWWGFNPSFITPALASAGFDLQLDTASPFTVSSVTDATHLVVSSTTGMNSGDTIFQTNVAGTFTTTITTVTDGTHLVVGSTAGWATGAASAITFDSPNAVTWTQSTAITFQNGNVRKGFAVPVATRIDAIVQTWYAQVRTHTGSYISDWSATLTWTIPQSVQQSSAEALMESLPDYHVYGKGDLLKPVNQRNTNLWLVEDMYGNQLDQVYYANFLTQTDNYIDLCVDENLYENFGVMFNFPKPNSMQYVDYRWILMNLYLASLVGSTNEAVILVVQSFTGVPPEITDVRDEEDFFLNTVLDPPIVPDVPQSIFHTSYPYIDASLVVEQLSTLTVASTTGFSVGEASDSTTLASFLITSINSDTELGIASVPYLSSVRQLNPGDTIVQGPDTTTISVVTEGGLVSPSNYTTDGVQGTWMMNTPTEDTLQATFKILVPSDPDNLSYLSPVVFDSLSGATVLSGLVTFTNGSTTISGVGTLFLSQFTMGEQITDPTGIYLGTIDAIATNTSATLLEPWAGPTEVVTAYLLQYTDSQLPPPILWDKSTLAFGVIITILNPGQFALT